MKISSHFTIAGFLLLLIGSTTYAMPTVSSEINQTFNKNQISTQLRTITITEDSQNTFITSGVMKLTIPDTIAIIFDDERTLENIVVYGTAVDNGKVLATPTISFENKDKTLILPVAADFSPGEYVVIAKAYVEGFNTVPSTSSNFVLTINGDEAAYIDSKYIHVQSSSLSDSYEPEPPTNIVAQDDGTGVKLTWEDPTDLDVQTIQILKGVNNTSMDASSPILVGEGVQEYIDTEVTQGDTVKYILRANDGLNISKNSEEITFVVGSSALPTEEPSTETPDQEETGDESTTEPDTEVPPTEESQYCAGYTDILAEDIHCAALTYVTAEGIFMGYDDHTFRAEQTINRAETVKVIIEGLQIALLEDDHTQGGFTDTVAGDWYMPYLLTAKQKGIIQGYPDGTFKAEQAVTYLEMLKIFFEATDIEFPLAKDGDAWYQKYLDYAKQKNLVPYENILAGMKRVDVAELFYQWSQL